MTVLLGVAALILAASGVVAAATYEDDDAPPVTEVAGDVLATTTTAPPPPTTSSTVEPAVTTTSPPTTVRGTATSTTRAGATSTTAPRATTTTRPPGTTTTIPPQCLAEQIDISTTPGSNSYPAGQTVVATTTLRNRSSTPCFYRGYTVEFAFRDPGGSRLSGPVVHADDIAYRTFAPGQAITHTASWDPTDTPAPGIYSVEASWSFSGGRYGASRQFVLS